MMRATGFRTVVVSAVLLLAAAPAYAFRCGTRVITAGDPADKVLHFCGSPVSVQTRRAELSRDVFGGPVELRGPVPAPRELVARQVFHMTQVRVGSERGSRAKGRDFEDKREQDACRHGETVQ